MKLIIYSKDVNLIDRWTKLFSNFMIVTISDYKELQIEVTKESCIVLMNIQDCENEIDFCIPSLVENNALIMALDNQPNYEKGKILLSLGIKGYGNLMMHDNHLQDAINTIIDGNIWLYPSFINETINKLSLNINYNNKLDVFHILSLREKEVANLVLKGFTYPQISEELNITLRTVKAHTKNIYEKFHVDNRLSFILLFK